MTKFSKFDIDRVVAFRAGQWQFGLEKYGVSSNLEITVGNMKFSAAEVEIKVKAKVKGAKTIFESRIATLGLKLKNKTGDELVDYNTRAYKMPFVYRNASDGKLYKCDERMAKMLFAA